MIQINIDYVRIPNAEQKRISKIGVLHDGADAVYTYSSDKNPGEVSFPHTVESVTSLTVVLIDTADKSLPTNIALEIMGCYDPNIKITTTTEAEDGKFDAFTQLFITHAANFSGYDDN